MIHIIAYSLSAEEDLA